MNKKYLFLIPVLLVIIILGLKLFSQENDWLCQDGQWIKHGHPKTPKPTILCGPEVIVSLPQPDQIIKSPLVIEGQARGFWFFEASFPIKLLNEKGDILAIGNVQALTDWMTTDLVPFKGEIEFNAKTAETGTLVLEKDNPSDLPENAGEFKIPVRFLSIEENKNNPCQATGCSGQICSDQDTITTCEFLPEYACYKDAQCEIQPDGHCGWTLDDKLLNCLSTTKGKLKIKVFFNNSQLDPEFSCNKVFPVEREIPKTQAVAQAALEELLKGTETSEEKQGYLTSINMGVKIQKLTIENGVAKVDFDKQLEYQMGGSCRVSAIRAQITETLKQFPTVKEVIISINGRTEDILQP